MPIISLKANGFALPHPFTLLHILRHQNVLISKKLYQELICTLCVCVHVADGPALCTLN